MKFKLYILLTLWTTQLCYSQDIDTTIFGNSGFSVFRFSRLSATTSAGADSQPATERIIIKGNVGFRTEKVLLTPVENEILKLELAECSALRKQDTSTLKMIWIRDFTLDQKPNEMLNDRNTIPNYLSLVRMIESMSVLDNDMVLTTGTELYQEFNFGTKDSSEASQKFFHTWKRVNGDWKLAISHGVAN